MPQSDRWPNVNATWRRTSRLSMLVLCLAFVRHAVAEPQPTAALIDVDKSAVAGLLESRLLTDDSVRWVERTEIDRVLKEQQLQSAFGAAGVKERSSLGKLLKADLLVLVRETDSLDKKTRLIECVVCETKQGLRLRVSAVPSDKDAEKTAAALEAVAQAGLKKSREEIKDIVAVSPLVSDDLGFQYNYLQTAYAKIIEQVLLDVPGFVVVELGEAQAISRELAIGGNRRIERGRLPVFVMGRFRHSATAQAATVDLQLHVLRSDQEVARQETKQLAADQAAEWLRGQAAALFKNSEATPTVVPSSRSEARRLAQRAEEFWRIGNWKESLELCEASLLLDPDQQDMHEQCCNALSNLARPLAGQDFIDLESIAKIRVLYDRGIDHLERYLRKAEKLPDEYVYGWRHFINDVLTASTVYPKRGDSPELVDALQKLSQHRIDSVLRLAKMRIELGYPEDRLFHRAVQGLSDEQKVKYGVEVIEALAESKQLQRVAISVAQFDYFVIVDQPRVHHLVERLAKSESPAVRAAGADVRLQLSRAPKEQMQKPLPFKAPPDASATNLQPLDLKLEFPQGCQVGPDKTDIFWTMHTVFGMKQRDKLTPLWSEPRASIAESVWDGRYLWFTVYRDRGPGLFVIDPESGKSFEFTTSDGLPITLQDANEKSANRGSLHLAPLAPGRVCVIGHIERTWFAVATFSADGKKKAVVFHEAREVVDRERPQVENTNVRFQPLYMLALSGHDEALGRTGYRVIVGRHGAGHSDVTNTPLIVDPDRGKVEVAPFTRRIHGPGETAAFQGDAYYFDEGRPKNPTLVRIRFPGVRDIVMEDVTPGRLFANEQGVHVVGSQWRLIAPDTKEVQVLAPMVPWVTSSVGPPQYELIGVSVSSHYGLVAITQTGPKPCFGKIFRLKPLDQK